MPSPNLPAVPQPEAEAAPPRPPLVPERSDFLEGDAPAADKVEAFLARALEATGSDAPTTAGALVPWICDALLSNHSVKAYGRDLMDFLRHMQAQGVDPLRRHRRPRQALQAGVTRGRQDLGDGGPAALGAPRHLPAARRQGAHLLGDRPGHRRGQGPRRPEELDAVADPEAGDRPAGGDPDRHPAGHPRPGADERLLPDRLPGLGGDRGLRRAPRDRRRRALPPRHREAEQEAAEDPPRCGPAGPGLRGAGRHRGGQGGAALPADDAGRDAARSGGTWTARPPGGWSRSTARRPASTPTGWAAAASASTRLRKTAINDAIRNGASMHEVREFAGHADIRTTEVYFVRKEEDAEVAARRIQIRLTGRRGQ